MVGANITNLDEHRNAPSSILKWADTNRPGWADKPIERWDSDKFDRLTPFIKSHYWSDRHSVNVFSVVGTAHPDYIGLSWREFLHQGRRMRANQEMLATNPKYYEQTFVKQPSMLYISLNGKHWYVNGDGNHRTCLARFYFDQQNLDHSHTMTMVHGVTSDDYRVDWDLYHLYQNLLKAIRAAKLNFQIEPVRSHFERQDGPGWKIDKYQTQLKVLDDKSERIMGYKEANSWLHDIERKSTGLLRRFFK